LAGRQAARQSLQVWRRIRRRCIRAKTLKALSEKLNAMTPERLPKKKRRASRNRLGKTNRVSG